MVDRHQPARLVGHRRLEEVHSWWHGCEAHYGDPDAFRHHLNALIQALRNVTFALQAEKARILTYCNTGALATVDYGTALGVIRCAHENGRRVHVYVDETRPRLQGARLTAWELEQLGIPYTLIVDGASGYFMRKGQVDLCVVGCDRIAANGDTANKIGTYNLALAASAHQIPFYVAGPTSTSWRSGAHGAGPTSVVTDTGLYDWTRFPGIQDTYKTGKPATWGILQIRKKGLRDIGGTLAAEVAHRIAAGAETLALRMERACDNALRLARFLAGHPKVTRVYYPGLPDHPQHRLAGELFKAYGALMSVELARGIDCFDFLNRLKLVISSSHLGDNRTLAIPIAHTIYWEMGPQRRAEMGIADSLIRLSIGIEDFDDLAADFREALEGV